MALSFGKSAKDTERAIEFGVLWRAFGQVVRVGHPIEEVLRPAALLAGGRSLHARER